MFRKFSRMSTLVMLGALASGSCASGTPAGDSQTSDCDTLASCTAACEDGDGAACVEAGSKAGKEKSGDAVQRELFARGCALGNGDACFGHGFSLWFHFWGKSSPEETQAALVSLEKGCTLNSFGSCGIYADVLMSEGGEQARRAVPVLERVCTAPDTEWKWKARKEKRQSDQLCVTLADLVYWGDLGATRDEARAVRYYRDGCESEEPVLSACFRLAQITFEGRALQRDDSRAASYLMKACTGSFAAFPQACDELGDLVLAGKLLPADAAAARARLSDNCVSNPASVVGAESCLIAGDLIAPSNPTEGKRLWAAAAAAHSEGCAKATPPSPPTTRKYQGTTYAEHCTAMGHITRTGKGVAQDPRGAAAFYERGCELGSARGCFGSGLVARDGLGVPKDPVKARTRFDKACSDGIHDACVLLQAMN